MLETRFTSFPALSVDPRLGLSVDPRLGLSVDPRLGLSVDPRLGLSVDPRLGLSVDPRLGLSVDPRLGLSVDPRLGLSVDPRVGISQSALETDVLILFLTYDNKNDLLAIISFIFDITSHNTFFERHSLNFLVVQERRHF